MSTGIGNDRMETDTELATASLPSATTPVRQLPDWAPWGVLGATAVVVGGGTLLLGHGIGLAVALTAVLYAAAMYLASRTVEGPRKATDRLVTVWSVRAAAPTTPSSAR